MRLTGMVRKRVLGMTYLKKTTIQWFAIDEHNHGSFVTYPSQEVYEDFKATLEEWRKEQVVTLDIEKTMEAVGPIRVDVGS